MLSNKYKPLTADAASLFQSADVDVITFGTDVQVTLPTLFTHLSTKLRLYQIHFTKFVPKALHSSFELSEDGTHFKDTGSNRWYTYETNTVVKPRSVVFLEVEIIRIYAGFIMLGVERKDGPFDGCLGISRFYFNDYPTIVNGSVVGVLFDGPKKKVLWYLDGEKQGEVGITTFTGVIVMSFACGGNEVRINNIPKFPISINT